MLKFICFSCFYYILFNLPRPFILKQIIKTITLTEEVSRNEDDMNVNLPGEGGYEVVYSKLNYASKPDYDPLQGNFLKTT